jgi:protein arginine kinase activator
MMCENCKKRQATIHLTEIINDSKKEVHLCENCAEKQGVIKQQMSVADFLAGLAGTGAAARQKLPDIRCPQCGLTLAEFQSVGRFGCAEDYTAFRDRIMPLIEKIHDAIQHVGKTPTRAGRGVQLEKRLRHLQAELRRAVEREQYEDAARLRDEIRRLEDDSGGSGGPGGEGGAGEDQGGKEAGDDAAAQAGR